MIQVGRFREGFEGQAEDLGLIKVGDGTKEAREVLGMETVPLLRTLEARRGCCF